MRLVFAKTRYEYQSYSDLWKLVSLCGLETCWVDQIRYDEEAVFVLGTINGEFRPTIERERARGVSKKAKVVWWNLERVDSGPGGLNDLLGSMVCNNTRDMLEWVDKVWVSDRHMASLDPRLQFLVLGSHPGMATTQVPRHPDTYDFCHMSYVNERRSPVLSALGNLRMAPNAWEPERGQIIQMSKLMLNVHQTDAPITEPLRFAVAAAYGIPLVTEYLADPYPLQPGVHCLMTRYQDLPQITYNACRQDIEQVGKNLKSLLLEAFPFKDCVQTAFEELIR